MDSATVETGKFSLFIYFLDLLFDWINIDLFFVSWVLGKVKLSELGKTLTHEHMLMDFNAFYSAPPSQLREYVEGKIKLENVGFLKQYPWVLSFFSYSNW